MQVGTHFVAGAEGLLSLLLLSLRARFLWVATSIIASPFLAWLIVCAVICNIAFILVAVVPFPSGDFLRSAY